MEHFMDSLDEEYLMMFQVPTFRDITNIQTTKDNREEVCWLQEGF